MPGALFPGEGECQDYGGLIGLIVGIWGSLVCLGGAAAFLYFSRKTQAPRQRQQSGQLAGAYQEGGQTTPAGACPPPRSASSSTAHAVLDADAARAAQDRPAAQRTKELDRLRSQVAALTAEQAMPESAAAHAAEVAAIQAQIAALTAGNAAAGARPPATGIGHVYGAHVNPYSAASAYPPPGPQMQPLYPPMPPLADAPPPYNPATMANPATNIYMAESTV